MGEELIWDKDIYVENVDQHANEITLNKNNVEKVLIDIPPEGEYIEILGHKITGYSGWKEFLDHLDKCARIENNWKELREYFTEYRRTKTIEMFGHDHTERVRTLLYSSGC